MEKERCDNECEIFNARVNKDGMIITIAEYEDMKDKIENFEKTKKEYQAHIEFLEKIANDTSHDKENLLSEMKVIHKENRKLKNGILKFIKLLGGLNDSEV